MSREASNPPIERDREGDRDSELPARSRFSAGRLVVIALAAALAVWCGLRIRAAMKTQAALATERAAAASEAAAATNNKATGARTVEGVAARYRPEIPLEGTLNPAREAELAFKTGGQLAAIRVKLGDRVRAGDVLAVLDTVEAQAQAKAADAQVRAAEAQLQLAEDAARRTGSLAARGAATQQSGVQTEQQRSLAAAQLDAARAQLALAQASLKNHTLTAPFGGFITRVPSGAGSIVTPGVALFHVQDTSTLKLAGTVLESDAELTRVGAQVAVELDGRAAAGRVTAVLGSLDPNTRRVPVEAEIKNDSKTPLRGGAYVRARVVGLDEIDAFKLPSGTLRPGSQNEVMVVAGGKLHTRRLTFTAESDGTLLVRAGLKAGERVLVGPSAEAHEGQVAP